MALSRTPHAVGVQRHPRVGLGRFYAQPRSGVSFDPGALVVARVGSTIAEIPDPNNPRTDLILLGTYVGTFVFTASGTADANGGSLDANGAPETITIEPLSGEGTGDFTTGTGANQITSTMRDAPAFMYDNDTYYATDLAGTLSFGGWVADVLDNGKVMIKHSAQLRVLYELYSAGQGTPGIGSATSDGYARLVATNIPAGAFSGGVWTATATGAFPTQDGLAGPYNVGDVIVFPLGTVGTQVVAAADSGPYEYTTVGATGVKAVWTRPAWWKHGATIKPESKIRVGSEGALFHDGTWAAAPASAALLVGTGDPVLYPDRVTQTVQLSSSAKAITNVPIKSAGSQVLCRLSSVNGTTTNTVGYGTLVDPTPGGIGTATTTVNALAAGMTKNGTADTSNVTVTIIN